MKIEGFMPGAATAQNGSPDVLNRLKPGDTVRAQVLENSGSGLTLKLSDGSQVSASAMSPVDAKEGEFVNFVFKGTVEGKPAFEVAARAVPSQPEQALDNIKNTLLGVKLPLTDKNIELAQALKEQNIPVTAETMTKITELVGKNSDLKPAAAAFLTASNLSADTNNIDKLQSLLAGRLKIGNDLAELFRLAGGQNSGETADPSVVNRLLEKLMGELAGKGTVNSGNAAASSQTAAAGPNGQNTAANTPQAGAPTNAAAGTQTAVKAGVPDSIQTAATLPAAGQAASNTSPAAAAGTAQNSQALNEMPEAISAEKSSIPANANNPAGTAGQVESTVEKGPLPATQQAQNTAKINAEGLPDTSKGEDSNTGAVKILADSNNISEKLGALLKAGNQFTRADLPLLESLKSQVETMQGRPDLPGDEFSAAKLIAKEINTLILKIGGHADNIEQSSNSTPVQKNFEEAVSHLKSLVIRVDQKSGEINPVKLYHEIDSALQALKSSIQQLPYAIREAAANIANNLENNINFINQLNNYSSYVQLPLSIFSQNTTGELYMLKKGPKARKLDPSNMTVLISLDSNNIGRIDTLLSVDKNNISTNFRLEKSDVFQVLKENHKELYKGLLEKGFRLVDFTYRLMDEPINIVNFEAEARKEFLKSSNNIDIMI